MLMVCFNRWFVEVFMFMVIEVVLVVKVVVGNKCYFGVVVLDNVNFMFNKGEVCVLLGKNGVGKSIFIWMFIGSECLDSGDIWIGEMWLEGDEVMLICCVVELGVCVVY